MQRTMKTKVLAWVLSLLMVVAFMPTFAFAGVDGNTNTYQAVQDQGLLFNEGTLDAKTVVYPTIIATNDTLKVENEYRAYGAVLKIDETKVNYDGKAHPAKVEYYKLWHNPAKHTTVKDSITENDWNDQFDTVKLVYTNEDTGLPVAEPKNAGTYKVSMYADTDTNKVVGRITINKVDPVDKAVLPSGKEHIEYTGEDQRLAVPGECLYGYFEYALPNEEWTKEVPTAAAEGEYEVFYRYIPDENYNVPANCKDCTGDKMGMVKSKIVKAKWEYGVWNNNKFYANLKLDNDKLVEANAVVSAGDMVYDGKPYNGAKIDADKEWCENFAGDIKIRYYEKNGDEWVLLERAPIDAGNYLAKFIFRDKEIDCQFEISKAEVKIIAEPKAVNVPFDNEWHEMAVPGKVFGGHFEYALIAAVKDLAKKPAHDLDWSEEIPKEFWMGTYRIAYKVVADKNHKVAGEVQLEARESYKTVVSSIYDGRYMWDLEQKGDIKTLNDHTYVQAKPANEDTLEAFGDVTETLKLSVKPEYKMGEEINPEVVYSENWCKENNLPEASRVYYFDKEYLDEMAAEVDAYYNKYPQKKPVKKETEIEILEKVITAFESGKTYKGLTAKEASTLIEEYEAAPVADGEYIAVVCAYRLANDSLFVSGADAAEEEVIPYFASANFMIKPNQVEVIGYPEGVVKEYNGENQEIAIPGEAEDGHFEYALAGNEIANTIKAAQKFDGTQKYDKGEVIIRNGDYYTVTAPIIGSVEKPLKWSDIDVEGNVEPDRAPAKKPVFNKVKLIVFNEDDFEWSTEVPEAKEIDEYVIVYRLIADEDYVADENVYSVISRIISDKKEWNYMELDPETFDPYDKIRAEYVKNEDQNEKDYPEQFLTLTMSQKAYDFTGEPVEPANVELTDVWADPESAERGMAVPSMPIYKGFNLDGKLYNSFTPPAEPGNYKVFVNVNDGAETVATAEVAFSIETEILEAPKAVNVPYNGENQELAIEGEAMGCKFQYTVDSHHGKPYNWSDEVPVAKDIDDYTVYYRVVTAKGTQIGNVKKLNSVIYSDKEDWTYANQNAEAGNLVDTISAVYEEHDHMYAPQTLTLSIGASEYVYDGTPVKAYVELTDVWADETAAARGMQLPGKVIYEGIDGTEYPATTEEPASVGKYKARVELPEKNEEGNAVYFAEVEFAIVEGDYVDGAFAPTALTKVYNGEEQELVRPAYNKGITVEYSVTPNDEESWSEDIPKAKDAGSYDVYYRFTTHDAVQDGENYKVTATILPKALLIDWDEENQFDYDGTQKSIQGVAGEYPAKYALIGIQDADDNVYLQLKGAQATEIGEYKAEVVRTLLDSYLLGEDADNYILAPEAEKTYDWMIIHQHKFEYNTIPCGDRVDAVDVCCAGDTPCAGGSAGCEFEHARLFIEAPDVLYTGEEYDKAEIVKSENWDDGYLSNDISKINYYKDLGEGKTESLNRLPREAGKYVAVVFVGCHKGNSVCAATQFEIIDNPAVATTEPQIREGLVYNGDYQELVIPGSTDPGNTIMYAIGTTDVNDEDKWSPIAPSAVEAGQYPIAYYVKGDGKTTTDSPVYTLGNAKIDPKEVGLSWGQDIFTFDGYKHVVKPSLTGLVDDDTCTVKVTGAQTNVGTYTARAYGLSNSNYKLPANCTKSFKIVKSILLAQAIHRTKTTTTVNWTKVTGADKYVIYGAKCNKKGKTFKFKKYKTVGAGYTSIVARKLVKYREYKFYVVAYRSGKVIAKSKLAHCITYNTNKKMKKANVKSITAVTKKITIKANGNPGGVLGVYKVYQNKKCLDASHAKAYRYLSSNPYVAKVNSLGTVTGLHKGNCKVYIQAVNGMWCSVNVTVK